MDRTERRNFRMAAKSALAGASYDPKKLILIHTGAAALLSLLVSAVAYVLEQEIAGMSGLGGLGTRGILMTVRTLLQILPLLILPFWNMGYIFVTVMIVRGKQALPGDLAEGFRSFLPVLRLELLLAVMYGLLIFGATQLGSTVFMLTPWADPFMDAIFAYAQDPGNAALEAAMNVAAYDAALPMLGIVGTVFIVLAAPFFYRFRMAQLYLMEHPQKGALAAMRASAEMTRFRRLELLRLDLSFWWFYLLDLLAAVLCYGEILLALAGIFLPWNEAISYFGFLILSVGCQILLYWWRKNEVFVTYAQVYTALQQQS